ncbi:MAG: hypothetical protein DDT27_01498 [Dehalococcoidia bacterium]|nr:hypothetical protein [Chloroflexota bacterium]MBT9163847.1 hypothetical protein [Chloroflexota bacterium]
MAGSQDHEGILEFYPGKGSPGHRAGIDIPCMRSNQAYYPFLRNIGSDQPFYLSLKRGGCSRIEFPGYNRIPVHPTLSPEIELRAAKEAP